MVSCGVGWACFARACMSVVRACGACCMCVCTGWVGAWALVLVPCAVCSVSCVLCTCICAIVRESCGGVSCGDVLCMGLCHGIMCACGSAGRGGRAVPSRMSWSSFRTLVKASLLPGVVSLSVAMWSGWLCAS
jgi:hypothetical protein